MVQVYHAVIMQPHIALQGLLLPILERHHRRPPPASTRGSASVAHHAQAEVCNAMTTKVSSDLLNKQARLASRKECTGLFRYAKEKQDERKEAEAQHHRATTDAQSSLDMTKDKMDMLRSLAGDESMPQQVREDAKKKIMALLEDL